MVLESTETTAPENEHKQNMMVRRIIPSTRRSTSWQVDMLVHRKHSNEVLKRYVRNFSK